MLNLEEIEFIGPEVRRFCTNRGISSFLSIVTNGTLLTATNTERLVSAGVEFAMVTLDGPQAIHDERRPFVSGQGTFEIVLQHICTTVDRLKIYLLMNVDRHNCNSGKELIETLAAHNLSDRLYGVFVAFVEPTRPMTEHCQMFDMPRGELATYNVSINKAFLEHGFRIRNLVQLGFCTMNNDDNYIFDPRGDIYKCITGVGDEHFRVGSLDDDLNTLAIRASQFIENDPCNGRPECLTCRFLPMCKGGCRHESYVRYGDATRGICMRDYYETWVPEVIKQIYAAPAFEADVRRPRWVGAL